MSFWAAFFDEIGRPTGTAPGPLHAAYERAVVGMAHMALGAAAASILPMEWAVLGAVARLTVMAVYWLAKESGDLKRGGTVADGIEDAACVGLGCWTFNPWAVLGVGLYLMWRGYAQRA
jgi:hypothetical protein